MSARPRAAAAVPLLGTAITATLLAGVLTAVRASGPAGGVALAGGRVAVDLTALAVAPRGDYRQLHAATGDAGDMASLSGRDEAARAFRQARVRNGHVRIWRTVDRRSTLTAFVFEFADETSARRFAGGLSAARALVARPRTVAVAGVPGAAGVVAGEADPSGRLDQVVVIQHGRLACLLVYAGSSVVAPAPALVELARRQYEAMAAASATAAA